MRKLAITVMATSLLAGGALTGVAMAAPSHHAAKPQHRPLHRSVVRHESQSRDLRSRDLRSRDLRSRDVPSRDLLRDR